MKITRQQLRDLIIEAMDIGKKPKFPDSTPTKNRSRIQGMYDSGDSFEAKQADSFLQAYGYEGDYSRDMEDYDVDSQALADIEDGYLTTSDPFSMANTRRNPSEVDRLYGSYNPKAPSEKIEKGKRQQKRYNLTRGRHDADMHLMTPEELAAMTDRITEPFDYDGDINI